MQKFFAFVMILSILILSSCGHHTNTPGSLTLKYKPVFGPNALSLNTTYQAAWPNNQYYNFTNLKFFLSHIKLVRADASIVEVNPLVYVSLDNTGTFTIPLGDSVGSYTGMKFSIGLDTTQDNYDINNPINTDASYPLNQQGMYWSAVQKYVFVRMDVGVDTASNITQADALAYHVGTSPYYTTTQISFSQPLVVSGSSASVINLTSDIQKIFTGTNAINPLVEHGTMTSGNNDTLAFKFMTNFANSFSIQ